MDAFKNYILQNWILILILAAFGIVLGTTGFIDKKATLRYNTPQIFDIYDNESYTKCVIEYISGMTDQFAIEVYEEIISF